MGIKNNPHRIFSSQLILAGIILLLTAVVGGGMAFAQYRENNQPRTVQFATYGSIPAAQTITRVEAKRLPNSSRIALTGWALKREAKVKRFTTRLLLFRKGSKSALSFRTQMVKQEDPALAGPEDLSYQYAGFATIIDARFLKDDSYQIGFLINADGVEKVIQTKLSLHEVLA